MVSAEPDSRTRRQPTSTDDLSYFVEWGGRAWLGAVELALRRCLTDLEGQRVLELGSRSGRLAALLASRGALVHGVDIREGFEPVAYREAERWGVRDRVQFDVYGGDPEELPAAAYDIVFTKSVLVTIGRLDWFLPRLLARLRPAGRACFIENGRGSSVARLARAVRRRPWRGRVDYWTEEHLEIIRAHLSIETLHVGKAPPIYVVCGRWRRADVPS